MCNSRGSLPDAVALVEERVDEGVTCTDTGFER